MRIWQHLCVWIFFIYLAVCASMIWWDHKQLPWYVPIILILLPFVLGPLALTSFLVDVFQRFPKGPTRQKWAWLCALLWPVAAYYYFAFARRPLPELPQPPPIPTQHIPLPPAGLVPPPLSGSGSGRSSGLATASLCCGIVSALGMLIPLVIPLSLAGIVCGHLGMRDIRRNAGMLAGKSNAVIGLVTSYLSLLVSSSILASVIWLGTSIASGFEENSSKHLVNEPGFQAAQTAERAMDNIAVISGQGNTLAAEALAADLGRRLVELQTLSFAEERNVSERLLSLPPIVYCHLEKDSCVVILRMRFPVKWGAGVQRDYCRLIWDLLQVSVDELRAVPEGSRLALAIRGTFTYEEMLFGASDASSGSLPGHEPEFVEFAGQLAAKRRLYACFSAIKPSQEAAHKE